MNFESYLSLPLPNLKELSYFLRKDKKIVMLEVGSCEGEDTIKYFRYFNKPEIHCFEPSDVNFEKLKFNLEKYRAYAQINRLALSDNEGISKFYLSNAKPGKNINGEWDYGNKSNSLLEPHEVTYFYDWLEFKDSVNVQTMRLDTYVKINHIGNIDFIHIDVQGAEALVLNGSGDVLKDIKTIWLEVENVEFYKNQLLREDLEKLLRAKGFTLVTNKVDSYSGDQFYVNRRFFNSGQILFFYATKYFSKAIEKFLK